VAKRKFVIFHSFRSVSSERERERGKSKSENRGERAREGREESEEREQTERERKDKKRRDVGGERGNVKKFVSGKKEEGRWRRRRGVRGGSGEV
jgi:hypothetical protein